MPRVSQEHLAARRQHILDAGRRCFTRNGFHATSMQDVIAEAGVSVGAFYRYFKSKEELIEAIAEDAVGRITDVIKPVAMAEPAPSVPDALRMILGKADQHLTRDGMFAMGIQVWAESLRSQQHAALIKRVYRQVTALYERIAERARDAGHLPPDTDPAAVATVLFGLLPGYGLQRVLMGRLDKETYLRGIEALFKE
ncbi:TetR/AcrR family transcriptional regulator [Allorhizocola rhizosphaerae]|uniref:TetR/AcrR family transcriptional regulator n=1 Tax=Allorhizocola rhizosphaerae TaxID=1872709 RepID=UPI000E3DB81A|nr:TetR/AcrR family transcriptional regulator [Allorhizocola rhizosphaerae]